MEELKRILKELSEGYNPNYQVCLKVVLCRPVSHSRLQDMAVKAAVVGYTEKYVIPAETAETTEESLTEPVTEEESPEVLVSEQDLDELEKLDLDALLMSGDSWGLGGDADGEEDEHEGARECLTLAIFMRFSFG